MECKLKNVKRNIKNSGSFILTIWNVNPVTSLLKSFSTQECFILTIWNVNLKVGLTSSFNFTSVLY